MGLQSWFKEEAAGFEVLTIFDLLTGYIRSGRIKLDPARHPLVTTYHDPCHYTRLSRRAFGRGYGEEGRFILRRCCPSFVDMEPNRDDNYCCGAGGGLLAMPFREERVFHGRRKAEQIARTGAGLVVSPCNNCRDQIAGSLKKEFGLKVEVKNLIELVAESLVFKIS